MREFALVVAAVHLSLAALAGDRAPVLPYEVAGDWVSANPIDDHVLATLKAQGIEPTYLCSDAVFVRRAYLDLIGTLPEPNEVREFTADRSDGKRAALIDALLARDEYADYWALKWSDLLRVKAEFPINLWPNAVQAYHRYVRDSIAENKPYDQFAREMLTLSGSNFRVPAVNFYRAIQGQEPAAIARAVGLTFMGTRPENWPAVRRREIEVFFSRIAFKKTAEWKEEIVFLNPAPAEPVQALLPDGTTVVIESGADPRRIFADWLITAENPWFARCVANRVWAWLLGRGIVHEPDDIRPDNPPVNPELLAYLEAELVRSGYDLRYIYRLILNSRTYQQSAIPCGDRPEAEVLFGHYAVRRLDAEVLIDALCSISGLGESYSSAIPEPFTFVPEEQRTIALADGSITSQFLEMFGRPARDTGLWSERDNQPTRAQRLHLLNSSHVRKKIENGPNLRLLLRGARGNRRGVIRSLFLTILSREPTITESQTAWDYLSRKGGNSREAAADLAWALINTKEFLYRH